MCTGEILSQFELFLCSSFIICLKINLFLSDKWYSFVLKISELNLADTTNELEALIYSTLSSDITLYEKISTCSYRLRINSRTNEAENCQSDTDDSGSIDDDSKESGQYGSSDDSDSESGASNPGKLIAMNHHKVSDGMLTIHTEIDESYPGEVWLLGLMEGEYSDLSIEEKLNALMALVDLVSGGSSIRMEVIHFFSAFIS